MTEVTELRFAYTDLTLLSVACKRCGAEVVLNIADPKQHRPLAEGTVLSCGVCRTDFDSTLKGALVRFNDWLRLAQESGVSITFRVRVGTTSV